MGLHWSRPKTPGEVKFFTGCPFPTGFLLESATCGYGHCSGTDVDETLGLCPEHLARARHGLATKRW
jgi:hypothetical protein